MPVPKQRHSRTRSKRDRSQWIFNHVRKLKKIVIASCQKCGASRLAHFACPECGAYADRSVRKVTETKPATTVIKV